MTKPLTREQLELAAKGNGLYTLAEVATTALHCEAALRSCEQELRLKSEAYHAQVARAHEAELLADKLARENSDLRRALQAREELLAAALEQDA